MKQLLHNPCLDEPEFYKTEVRPNRHECYAYILCCVEDDAMQVLKNLDEYFKLKPGSVGDPDLYL